MQDKSSFEENKKIIIPDFEREDILSPQIKFLIQIYTEIKVSKKNTIFEIDFCKANFCNCFLLGILHSFIYSSTLEGFKFNIKFSQHSDVDYYLKAIHFQSITLIDNIEKINSTILRKGKNYLPIIHFPTAAIRHNNDLMSDIWHQSVIRTDLSKNKCQCQFKRRYKFNNF
jgi:hypothetical protein